MKLCDVNRAVRFLRHTVHVDTFICALLYCAVQQCELLAVGTSVQRAFTTDVDSWGTSLVVVYCRRRRLSTRPRRCHWQPVVQVSAWGQSPSPLVWCHHMRHTRTRLGDRSFDVARPWLKLEQADSLCQFRRQLKTFLFVKD